MLYRIAGMLFAIFGGLNVVGYLSGSDAPRVSERTFATEYSGLISGTALLAIGLYLLIKRADKKA